MTARQPFSRSESSIASHTVHVASGRMGQYWPSWCIGTSIPSEPGLQKIWHPHMTKSPPITHDTRSRRSSSRARSRKAGMALSSGCRTPFVMWMFGSCSGRVSGLAAMTSSAAAASAAMRSVGHAVGRDDVSVLLVGPDLFGSSGRPCSSPASAGVVAGAFRRLHSIRPRRSIARGEIPAGDQRVSQRRTAAAAAARRSRRPPGDGASAIARPAAAASRFAANRERSCSITASTTGGRG